MHCKWAEARLLISGRIWSFEVQILKEKKSKNFRNSLPKNTSKIFCWSRWFVLIKFKVGAIFSLYLMSVLKPQNKMKNKDISPEEAQTKYFAVIKHFFHFLFQYTLSWEHAPFMKHLILDQSVFFQFSLVLLSSLDLFSIAALPYVDVHCSPVLPEAVCDNWWVCTARNVNNT